MSARKAAAAALLTAVTAAALSACGTTVTGSFSPVAATSHSAEQAAPAAPGPDAATAA
ncbi:hypothetical protein [Pseudonocardia sp. ICBG601]|uniref:hypothetical protein n=1 Tax=Pseudonocardia sp. ICBG601 TaxID=2846759 RepID=UPI001CF71C60|nr:hypothetical protein [Pseudonocardia sp. ICBG601]